MQHVYDSYLLRRGAEGRIFTVSPKMPFEYFIHCFQNEQPFFLVSQLEDGRVAITPNVNFIPFNLLKAEYWPQDLLPKDYEYVTMKKETYPVIMSAHPIARFDEWYRNFQACVTSFAKQSLAEFVATSPEFLPLEVGRKIGRILEPVTA